MNNEKLLDVLEDMNYAALIPHSELYIDATKEELSEALKQLRELVERDTPKKPTSAVGASMCGMSIVVAGKCPNCGADRTRQDAFCNCGQRMDWEY